MVSGEVAVMNADHAVSASRRYQSTGRASGNAGLCSKEVNLEVMPRCGQIAGHEVRAIEIVREMPAVEHSARQRDAHAIVQNQELAEFCANNVVATGSVDSVSIGESHADSLCTIVEWIKGRNGLSPPHHADVDAENPLDRMSGGSLVNGIEAIHCEFPIERTGGVDGTLEGFLVVSVQAVQAARKASTAFSG